MKSLTYTRCRVSGLLAAVIVTHFAVPLGWSADIAAVQTQIVFGLSTVEMAVEKGKDGVTVFTGAQTAGEPGEPALPKRTIRALLPPHAALQSVTASLVDEKSETVPGKWEVSPMYPAATLGGDFIWPVNVRLSNGKSVETYENDSYFPSSFLGHLSTGTLRQWKLVEVEVFPYRYNPVRKELVKLTQGQLVVRFTETAGTRPLWSKASPLSLRMRDVVKSMVTNFDNVVAEYDKSAQ